MDREVAAMSRLLLASALLFACGRGAPTASTSSNTAADTLLEHLPAGAEIVVAGSFTELASWPVWRKAVQAIAFEAPGVAERVSTRCNVDPWTVLDAAALAFTADVESSVLVAQTALDRKQLHECIGKAGDDPITVTDGAITKYGRKGATELAAWFGDRMFLAVPARMDEPGAIEPLVAVRPVPEPLQKLLARVDRTAGMWGVALAEGRGPVAALIGTMPLESKPKGVHATIRRIEGLHINLAFVFADPAAAGEAVKLLERAIAAPPPFLEAWKDALRVEAGGDEARVSFDLGVDRARAFDSAVVAALPQPTGTSPPAASPPP
jgi:hypothetical protein